MQGTTLGLEEQEEDNLANRRERKGNEAEGTVWEEIKRRIQVTTNKLCYRSKGFTDGMQASRTLIEVPR